MRLMTSIALLALALAAGAQAKAPPSGIQLCGTNGCSPIAPEQAEQLFTLGGPPGLAAAPAPFYRLRWTWDEGRSEDGGYWLPDANVLRLGGWVAPDADARAILAAAAQGLEPYPLVPPESARVGGRAAADPASYALLLTVGTRVSTWVGALDWIPVELASSQPSPWTEPSYDLRVSEGSGFVWREGAVFRIPLAVARAVRLGRSIGPAAPPAGFASLGERGCAPASPRLPASLEVFGTAYGTQLWALVPGLADGTRAALANVVGRRTTIAVRFGGAKPRLSATGPGGAIVAPDSGPDAHLGSSWKRPGREWSLGLTFPSPGCWRLHAGDGTVAGDLWLDVRS
jgi:hypothetical protein